MSKAFTRESDGDDDLDEAEESPPPPGGKNYITPAGAERLRQELYHLRYKERPEVTQVVAWAAGNGDRSENGDYLYGKKRLREIDKRIRFLTRRLQFAEEIDPARVTADTVQFGATVTVRDEEDRERTWAIVGIDEVDVAKGRISWASPLAAALMKARAGDVVIFRSPRGAQEIEIMSIEYRELP